MIDLHTHSTASDGTDSPETIPELAARAGCTAVALTDHDTFAGLPRARRRAAQLGVELVGGCEVSCAFRGRSAHVLTYFAREDSGPLADELVALRADRVARNHALADRLASLGLPATYEEALAEASGDESLGRPHFAQVLVRNGAVESVTAAFDTWLAEGRPAHVPKARLAPAALVRAARQSGGVCVLAHPLSLRLPLPELAGALTELAAQGLVGLEAHYGRYRPDQRAALAALAAERRLVATGGSDYHGTNKPGLSVCTGEGDLAVPDSVLDQLHSRRPH